MDEKKTCLPPAQVFFARPFPPSTTMTSFYDLPIELRSVIYEKCGRPEWTEKIASVNADVIQHKKTKEFSNLLFRSRRDPNALWQLRGTWR